MRPISNPPNPYHSTEVDWLGDPPAAELTIFEEESKTILTENNSPDVGMRFSLNPYRGCQHACAYCLTPNTPVLMGDGRTRRIADLRVGDEIYGTEVRGKYRRYVKTSVLAHWSTIKPAYRVTLEDGTALVTSADHRFLSTRGWKFVTGAEQGRDTRPRLTTNCRLLGPGAVAEAPHHILEYRRGYLCGMIRGDALLKEYDYPRLGRSHGRQYQFRLALADLEALHRARTFLNEWDVATHEFVFQAATATRREMHAIRTHARASYQTVQTIVEWPNSPPPDWQKGFLAGIFDAEGSHDGNVVRMANGDLDIVDHVTRCLATFQFAFVVETRLRDKPMHNVRLRGGLKERLRFFQLVDPAITRKRDFAGAAMKNSLGRRVVSVEPLGVDLEMFDITTGTGDFIADGVISHNCYARPSHQYWGFGAGTDFETRIIVKVNAPERLRAAFDKKSWRGDMVLFSGNTDCYQPMEASYRLTRRCLEVCLEYRNPIHIITKSALVRRDVDLLARLVERAAASVTLSIPFCDEEMARHVEPYAAKPFLRFETLRVLSEAGIETSVNLAPIIPGLNDPQIPEILERAHAAGARRAALLPVRLAAEVAPVFFERLSQAYPNRVAKVTSGLLQIRNGKLSESRFHDRMTGVGPRWEAIRAIFEAHLRRLGMNRYEDDEVDLPPAPPTFRRPSRQGELF